MYEQLTLFNYDFDNIELIEISDYKIRNKVRLIELFAGIGAQANVCKCRIDDLLVTDDI